MSTIRTLRRWWTGALLAGWGFAAGAASPGGEHPESIRVVMDNNYPPFVFRDEDGVVQGILVDQWQLWERKTGIRVEVHAMDWGVALERMRAGEFDVVDTVFRTEERARFLDFTAPYQRIEVPIFFDREIAGITDVKSVRGFAVGVKAGDASVGVLRRSGVSTLLAFPGYEAVVAAARDRKITVFVADKPPTLYFLHKFGMQDAFRHSAPLYVGEFHRAVAKGNAALLRQVEEGFARITPRELQAIDDRWYGVGSFNLPSLRWLWPIAVGSVLVVLALTGWNRLLRRTVRRRTAELSASEQQLRRSQEQLAATLDALPDLLFDVDREGRIFDFRAPDTGDLFVTPSTFLGRTFAEVLPAEAVVVIQAGLAEAATKGRHFGGTYRLSLTGDEHWFELSITRKGTEGAGEPRFVVLARDVTTRFLAERDLRDSERYNRTLFEQTPIGLALCRMDGSFVDVNPALARIVGRSVEEVRHLTYWEVTPTDYAPEEQRQLELLRTTGRYGPYEKHYRHRDGHLVPVSLSGLLLQQRGETFIWSTVEDITERRQSDEVLRSRELQIRHVLESADCLLWQALVVRRGTGAFDWQLYIPRSSLYRKLFGADPGKPPVLLWQELAVPELDTMHANCLRALDSGAAGYEQEFHAVVEGKAVWLREQVSIERGPAQAWTLVGIITDITARKLAEEQLAERESHYRELFENNPAPMLIYEGGSLRLLAVNEAFVRHYGYSRTEALALHLVDLYPADERGPIREVSAQLTGHAYAGEWHHLRKDGSCITIVARSHEIVFSGCAGRIAVITDITDRKQAEDALRAQEHQLDLITNTLPGPILRLDRDLRFLFANHACERWFGKPRQEIVGCALGDVWGAAAFTHAEASAVRALAGEQVTFETRVPHVDGGEHFGQVTLVPEYDADGAVCGIVVLVMDVTERVRAEEERKALEEQVLRSQRLESVGRLAGGIAHDLNNILAPVLLGSSLLRDVIESPEALDTLSAMEISAKRGADIISQLLTFSRGGTGERVPVQLALVLRDMVAIMRETFPKNIVTRTDIASVPWVVNGDATQLHQVVMNLCVNARDAMPTGGTLVLALENVELDTAVLGAIPGATAGPNVLLRVTDDGSGIARENLDKIFDPFFTTKDFGRGTGLGLSTVLGIVKSHGGIVQVDSRSGQGTQFRVYLPAQPDLKAGVQSAEGEAPTGEGELILLVDDETVVRGVTRRVLEQYHYRVVEAVDGRDALARFASAEEPITAVITDALMPVLDGPCFIRQLRQTNPTVPVIVVSGHADGAVPALLTQGQVQAVLAKPYAADALLCCLHRVLHPAGAEVNSVE